MTIFSANRVFIGLGSNLGDSRFNLARAIELLRSYFQTAPAVSSVYRSEPVEIRDQPWFLNQVISFPLDDGMNPLRLLQTLKKIELEMGRVPNFRYGPRLIDLDLLFYRNWVFECDQLTIPHPKITERSFVLMPLAELDSTLIHPRLGKTISHLILENSAILSFCEKT